jgi:hypothetical protein
VRYLFQQWLFQLPIEKIIIMQNTGVTCWILMAHSCHPSYFVGWGEEDQGLRPPFTNSSEDLSLNNKRKITLRYVSCGTDLSEREVLCSNPHPNKKKTQNVASAYWFSWVQRDSTQETLISENRFLFKQTHTALSYPSEAGVSQTFPQVSLTMRHLSWWGGHNCTTASIP